MKTVTILSSFQDFHAIAVAEAIRRKGGKVAFWLTSDFPTRMPESLYVDAEGCRFSAPGSAIVDQPEPDVVWNRRARFVLDTEILHPADVRFASAQCLQFKEGFYRSFAPQAFWVNPYAEGELAELKIYQHRRAAALGLDMPATLFSNDPAEIRRFLRAYGAVVYKPFRALPWRDGTTEWSPFTVRIDESQLVEDPLLMSTPGIYQQLVPKAFELRVTVIGHQIFAAKLLSQQTQHGRLDWRYAQDELQMEPFELPEPVAASCRRLLEELGLVFGCFDFIVTPSGRYVFLEVNQMGQWLFVEGATGQPLLDAFSEMLMQGRPDFEWSASDRSLRITEVDDAVWKVMRDHARDHVRTPDLAYCEAT